MTSISASRVLLNEIDEKGEGLTDWEREFVRKLIDEPPKVLTGNQQAKIQQIHEERVS